MTRSQYWDFSLLRCVAYAAVFAASSAEAALISPMTLHVKVGPDPNDANKFRYEFQLLMDNHSGTWLPVQGFGGIVFGDIENGSSPIADFQLDSASVPAGPWSDLGASSGFHNGPTLAPLVETSTLNPILWTPSSLGDQIEWAGASSTSTCDLTFSTLYTSNLGDPAEFQPVLCIPEPSTLALVGVALGISHVVVRRRRYTAGRDPGSIA